MLAVEELELVLSTTQNIKNSQLQIITHSLMNEEVEDIGQYKLSLKDLFQLIQWDNEVDPEQYQA